MDSSHLTGFLKQPVGNLGRTETNRPSMLKLKMPKKPAPQSTVGTSGRNR